MPKPKRLPSELRIAVEDGLLSPAQAQYILARAKSKKPSFPKSGSEWVAMIIVVSVLLLFGSVIVLSAIALVRWLFGLAFG